MTANDAPTSTPKLKVFISYAHADEGFVQQLAAELAKHDVDAWYDRKPQAGLRGGETWEERLAAELTSTSYVLVVLSPASTRKDSFVANEYLFALSKNVPVIPLLYQDCPIPLALTKFHYIDFAHTSFADAFASLLSSLPHTQSQPPALPPNLVHPYPMQANFTGRVSEREELTTWLANDTRPICALIAMGGMGKSALAWYWMTNDVLADKQTAVEGVMWWSFYEGESSFAKFIDDAFRYVTGQTTIDTARFPTPYDRAQELRQQLQHKRVLFILDGFERQLRAYARLDAAYQQDAAADTSADARNCVDPIAARWLRDISSGATRAKVLLTTRLMPRDLEDRAGDALAGVLKRELTELPREDAVAFMRAQGVTKGIDAEIANVCAAYGNHPLSLRLLSGFIKRDARMPGDITAAPRHDVHADLIQRQHHILEQSYNAMPEEERALLSRIAAFRNPMTYDALLIFNTLGNEARFDAALDDLRVRGLLQRDTKNNRYDLHPIVRRYAYDRLTDKTGVHTRLRAYFANIPTPDENEAQNIEDLAPVIELYHHTIRAGRYDEAAGLLLYRLRVPLFYRFGAYQIYIELLSPLFPDGEDNPPRLKNEHTQAQTLNELANSYALSGQSRRSLSLFEQHNSLQEKLDDKEGLAIGLATTTAVHINLGELTAAEQRLRRSIELCRESEDEYPEGINRQELGRLLAYRSEFDEAETELLVAQEIFDLVYEVTAAGNGVSTVRAYRALRAILMGNIEDALTMARESRKWADEVARTFLPFERDFIRAEWLLGLALVIEGKVLNAAAEHLTNALTRCRRINLVELESDILLAWARWHRARGDAEEAQAQAEEALVIADRCEYRLAQAETHNFLARLAWEAGRRDEARAQAEIAKERAWCDGPPHCYKPALDEAEGLLQELGAGGTEG